MEGTQFHLNTPLEVFKVPRRDYSNVNKSFQPAYQEKPQEGLDVTIQNFIILYFTRGLTRRETIPTAREANLHKHCSLCRLQIQTFQVLKIEPETINGLSG